MDEKKPESLSVQGPPTTTPPVTPLKSYSIDRKDRLLLLLAWGLGILFFELMRTFVSTGRAGLVVPVLVGLWYAVLIWYKGIEDLFTRPSLLLLMAVGLLSLTFSLFSNRTFQLWNLMLLPVLITVQLFQWSGGRRLNWDQSGMLLERARLLFSGLFEQLGASFQTVASLRRAPGKKRWFYVLLGLALTVPLLMVAVPILLEADAFFRYVIGGAVEWILQHVSLWILRLILGLAFSPFLFGLLYLLRRPAPIKPPTVKILTLDSALLITVLVVMDALYLFFVSVQTAALFGGEAYLQSAGITYAEYARSGFFQLVFIAFLNLTLVLVCLQVSTRTGRSWSAVRALCTLLITLSCVMLISAAWRMTLYVDTYGLSFKRFLTYWGMLMLAIFFTAAVLTIWKANFSFFRVCFTASVIGWLILNFINVDVIVSRYNVSAGFTDSAYFSQLSYDALPAMEILSGQIPSNPDLNTQISYNYDCAVLDASSWQTWSVSAQLAALRTSK